MAGVKWRLAGMFNNLLHFTPVPNIKKSSGQPCIMAQGMDTQKIFLQLGTGVECNKFLKIYCIFCVFSYLWKLPPTLAPAA